MSEQNQVNHLNLAIQGRAKITAGELAGLLSHGVEASGPAADAKIIGSNRLNEIWMWKMSPKLAYQESRG